MLTFVRFKTNNIMAQRLSSLYLLLAVALLAGACQSMEPLSIDYLLPADVTFPTALRKVGVVNNMRESDYNGDATTAANSLAETLADGNYFDQVIIRDSALRAHDTQPRESRLSTEEVNTLAAQLGVDFLVAVESVQVGMTKHQEFLPEWNTYNRVIDAKAYIRVAIYIPDKEKPMLSLQANDSIYWSSLDDNLPKDDRDVIEQASQFAGTLLVHRLIPHWETVDRFYFAGGVPDMRDAAVYVREKNWTAAIKLWEGVFHRSKGNQTLYAAAYNLAFGYEMLDDLTTAVAWAEKAQALAAKNPSKLVVATQYLLELQAREESLTKLNLQMKRINP
jgi:hypothetical protein